MVLFIVYWLFLFSFFLINLHVYDGKDTKKLKKYKKKTIFFLFHAHCC